MKELKEIITQLEKKIQFHDSQPEDFLSKDKLDKFFSFISYKEFSKIIFPMNFLIKDILPEKNITFLYGPSGVGKTTLVYQMIRAIGYNEPFLRQFETTTKKIPIFYLDYENPIPFIHKKTKTFGLNNLDNGFLWSSAFSEIPPIPLDNEEFYKYHDLPKGSLIIIDSFRDSHSADENSSEEMKLVMERLKELRKRYTVLVIHHTNKSGDFRGSTVIKNSADHFLRLEETGDGLHRLRTEKSRFEKVDIYLYFNSEKEFFELIESPETPNFIKIRSILEREGPMHFNLLFEKVKKELGIGDRTYFSQLMKEGIGKFWCREKIGKKVVYQALVSRESAPEVVEKDTLSEEKIKKIKTIKPIYKW